MGNWTVSSRRPSALGPLSRPPRLASCGTRFDVAPSRSRTRCRSLARCPVRTRCIDEVMPVAEEEPRPVVVISATCAVPAHPGIGGAHPLCLSEPPAPGVPLKPHLRRVRLVPLRGSHNAVPRLVRLERHRWRGNTNVVRIGLSRLRHWREGDDQTNNRNDCQQVIHGSRSAQTQKNPFRLGVTDPTFPPLDVRHQRTDRQFTVNSATLVVISDRDLGRCVCCGSRAGSCVGRGLTRIGVSCDLLIAS